LPVTSRRVVLSVVAVAAALAVIAPTSVGQSSLVGGDVPAASARVLRDCPVVPVRRIVRVIGPLAANPAPVFEFFTFRGRTEYDCEATNDRTGKGTLWVRIDAFCSSPRQNRERYNASWNMAKRDASPRRLSGLGTAAFTMNFAGIRWLYILTEHAFTTVRMIRGGTQPGPLASTLALGRAALGFDCRVRP
jgi:hypothetical protein